jgi:predicted Holliday junction resolvase-like endonuclease
MTKVSELIDKIDALRDAIIEGQSIAGQLKKADRLFKEDEDWLEEMTKLVEEISKDVEEYKTKGINDGRAA